jgi:hypothetical protein
MEGGSINELLNVAVERSVLHQFKVEVGRTLEDRVQPGLTGDDGTQRHLHPVDETGGHRARVHRQAAVRPRRPFPSPERAQMAESFGDCPIARC